MKPTTYTDELNNNSRWYALYTRSRYEKKVDHLLKEKGITSYLPLNEVYHRWSDRRQKVLMPLFSCYVFVFIALRDRFKVLQTDGAIKLVSFNGKPAVIPDDQISMIKRILDEKMSFCQPDSFTPGKKVKISREAGKPAYEPTLKTALDGTYPISRPLYMYTLGEPTGEIRKYLQWIYSDVGQAIVEQSGYVPLPQEERIMGQK